MYMIVEYENRDQWRGKGWYISVDIDTEKTRKWYDWNYEVTNITPDFATVEEALKHIEDNNICNTDLLIPQLQERGWKSERGLLILEEYFAQKKRLSESNGK